jgi:CcmD family protein
MIRRASLLLWSFLLLGVPLLAQGEPSAAQNGFVPVTELPPTQQLPAAPYLVAAYAFIWIALIAYVFSIWRRLGKVENEMKTLEHRRK